jgi:hypothetical protein
LIRADGGVSGTFDDVSFDDVPDGLGYEIVYNANTVELVVSGGLLLGDADLSGVVDFADIPAFIQILMGGTFLDEADCDRDGDIDFDDIPVFIQILLAA